ncbi:hypothetical protein ACWGJ2_30810 [Streptomyces sp. NPDC054796]
MSGERQRNRALEELLRTDGWTRAGLADAVCTASAQRGVPVVCTDRHVRRWVSGEVRWPQERYLVPLQQVLGVPPEAMGFVPRSAVPTPAAPLPPAPVVAGAGPRRRTVLAGAVAGVLRLEELPVRGHLAAADMERLNGTLARLSAHFNGMGGGATRAAARELLVRLRETAGGCTYGPRAESELYAAMASAAGGAGWAAADCGRRREAGRMRHDALTAALLSGDRLAVMRAWGDLAVQVEREGRPWEAARICRNALADRHVRSYPAMATLLHARLADYAAGSGDVRAMGRHLAAAERVDDRRQERAGEPSWLAFLGAGELRGLGALAHRAAGQYGQAEAMAMEAAALTSAAGMARNALYYGVVTAELQWTQGHREAATATVAGLRAGPGAVVDRVSSPAVARRLRVLETRLQHAGGAG